MVVSSDDELLREPNCDVKMSELIIKTQEKKLKNSYIFSFELAESLLK